MIAIRFHTLVEADGIFQIATGIFTIMKAFFSRVRYALQGWVHFFSHETNGRIQAVVAIVVSIAGWVFQISPQEWLWILLCTGLVISLEMVNTAIETLADRLHPDRHPEIKIVKDVAAGAVLWAAIMSVVIGVIIFLPRVWAIVA
ncbi:MAG TPA: diacylglycerol kinase family protein [Phnomibacter sp.]|nr:diacylglycerol kinase family protein [Phnomibacter sp.]